MNYSILKPSFSEGVALLVISRPEALNALNSRFFNELNDFIDNIESDPENKVLIITGEGKSFVSGADIAEMADMTAEEALAFSEKGQRAFNRLEDLAIPVIAAVNGYALGGGCELAMACDFRIASYKARFGQPEVNLGLIPGYAGTQRLSRLTGLGNALYLILTAEMINAEEALRMGLIQKITEPESLISECMKLARLISSNGSQALLRSKSAIRSGYTMDFSMACDLEAQEFSSLFSETSTQEGMKAFLEKRKPDW